MQQFIPGLKSDDRWTRSTSYTELGYHVDQFRNASWTRLGVNNNPDYPDPRSFYEAWFFGVSGVDDVTDGGIYLDPTARKNWETKLSRTPRFLIKKYFAGLSWPPLPHR